MKSSVLFFSFLFLTFSLTFVSAQPWTEQTSGSLFISVPGTTPIAQGVDHHFHLHLTNETNNVDNSSANCKVTFTNKTGFPFYTNEALDYHAGSENEWGVTILGGNFTTLGGYNAVFECTTSDQVGTDSIQFYVTSTGISSSSFLDNAIILLLLLLSFILIGFGGYMKFPFLGFVGSILLILVGVYTMIYGLNNVADLYTQAAALVMIGIGFIFMFISSYEWLSWGSLGRGEEE